MSGGEELIGQNLRIVSPPPLDPASVLGGGDKVLLAGSYLEREGTLPSLREKLFRVETETDFVAATEAVEPCRGEHDRVEAALVPLAEAGVDVPAQRLDHELGLECQQLGPPPHRSGADAHPR